MFTLVIGGSASGKSDYAERHVLAMEAEGPRIYIATMEPFGEEARARIERHHAMRRDRGFETIECYRNAGKLVLPEGANVLLEDLGNLTANELFGGEQLQTAEQAENDFNISAQKDICNITAHAEKQCSAQGLDICTSLSDRIASDIDSLLSQCRHLTIVTNEVFSGGKEYEGETLTYLRVLAALNRKLAAKADLVVELVCGLPEVLKDTGAKK